MTRLETLAKTNFEIITEEEMIDDSNVHMQHNGIYVVTDDEVKLLRDSYMTKDYGSNSDVAKHFCERNKAVACQIHSIDEQKLQNGFRKLYSQA